MPEYRVTWVMDFYADSHQEAAIKAADFLVEDGHWYPQLEIEALDGVDKGLTERIELEDLARAPGNGHWWKHWIPKEG